VNGRPPIGEYEYEYEYEYECSRFAAGA